MRELSALIERHNETQDVADYRVGQICALIANVNRDPKKSKRYNAWDFFTRRVEPPDMKPTNDTDVLNGLLALAASLGSDVVVTESNNG